MDPISAITGAGGGLALAGWWIKTLISEKEAQVKEIASMHSREVAAAKEMARLAQTSLNILSDNSSHLEDFEKQLSVLIERIESIPLRVKDLKND